MMPICAIIPNTVILCVQRSRGRGEGRETFPKDILHSLLRRCFHVDVTANWPPARFGLIGHLQYKQVARYQTRVG